MSIAMIGRATALLLALACVAVTLPASAAGPAATTTANVPRLPETLTRESARDLLSRLSDAEVRTLLLEQLDRAAAPVSKPGPSKGGMGEMAGMAGVVDQHAGSMRDARRAGNQPAMAPIVVRMAIEARSVSGSRGCRP